MRALRAWLLVGPLFALIVACGVGREGRVASPPAFVQASFRLVGTAPGESRAWTPSEARIAVEGCAHMADNRILIVKAGAPSLANLTQGSSGCQAFLESLVCRSGSLEENFWSEVRFRVEAGGRMRFRNRSGEGLDVVAERGLGSPLGHWETISLAVMPPWGENRIPVSVSVKEMAGTAPLPKVVVSGLVPVGAVTPDGDGGLSLFLDCIEERVGTLCAGQSLFGLRFRFVDHLPKDFSRESLLASFSDESSTIVPNETHLWGNGLRFSLVARRVGGRLPAQGLLLAAWGDSLLAFTLDLTRLERPPAPSAASSAP